MKVYCGIDWAERHHDVALVDEDGRLVAKKRIHETVDGFGELMEMLTAAGDCAENPIPVAIETPRGLLVAALRATGRPIYPINPLASARYRDRHTVSRGKSDHGDAMVLANILRTDAHAHRQLPDDSEQARAVAVLARAQQDATWRRTNASNELRSHLREYFPTFLAAFGGTKSNLINADVRAVLTIAPTPGLAAKLTKPRIAAALKRAGRQRRIAESAATIQAALRQPQLRHDGLVEQAMAAQTLALLGRLNAECDAVDQLAKSVAEAFHQHPDYEIITSFPGLGELTGARILAEIGDDRSRFADARALKAYAGSAPITRASGRSISIKHRKVKNNRLATAGFVWAFMAVTNYDSPKAHYLSRRERGDKHSSALRHLFNRLLGQLHHCLKSRQLFDETKAFTLAA